MKFYFCNYLLNLLKNVHIRCNRIVHCIVVNSSVVPLKLLRLFSHDKAGVVS